jgi:drug/metabolite transporter (DMT)-like permease
MKPKALFAILGTVLVWASAFAAIRLALAAYSPGALALFRFSIAAIVLLTVAIVSGARLPALRDLPIIVLCAFLGVTVYHVALNYGQVSIKAGPAAFLINSGHIFTALLAYLVLKERLSIAGWGGMFVSLSGVTMLAFREGAGFSFEPGVLLILLAAAASSVYIILQKRCLVRYGALEFATYVICTGTLFMLVFTRELQHDFSLSPVKNTLAVVYLGAVPAALGYLGWTYVIAQVPASTAVSFLYLVPVLATVIAWIWLGEIPSRSSFIGGGLALLGVIIVQRFGKPSIVITADGSSESVYPFSNADEDTNSRSR